jgi:hypothetical protein
MENDMMAFGSKVASQEYIDNFKEAERNHPILE